MRKAGLAAAVLVALALGVAVLVELEPWYSDRDRELRWVEAYASWREEVDRSLFLPDGGFRECEASLPEGPTARTREAAVVAKRGCRALARTLTYQSPPPDVIERWDRSADGVVSALVAGLLERTPPRPAPELARPAEPFAGSGRVRVLCWAGDEWTQLAEEWQLLLRDEFWLSGYADPRTRRIHLAPFVCEPLRRFFTTRYEPFGHEGAYVLAEALVTLMHEAEHLRRPDASEADVECVALQRVRPVVLAVGRSERYADEMAGLAWEIGYPDQLEDYRTTACHDGGPLDLHPETNVWP